MPKSTKLPQTRVEPRTESPRDFSIPYSKKTETPVSESSPGRYGVSGKTSARRSFTDADKELAMSRYLAGDSTSEIARAIGCSDRTVRKWAKAHDWQSDLAHSRETVHGLEAQILRLTPLLYWGLPCQASIPH
jgi:hypothetical protein